uniref:Putative terminase n=1 Tax=viral metagenome TaxID=1070528 RepID=A0A6M3KQH2_9ZZZZ
MGRSRQISSSGLWASLTGWGKTRLGSLMCIAVALHGGRAWWVAPSYPVSAVGWRGIRQLARQIPDTDIRHVDRIITMPSGGTVQVRSADNPDSLRGEGLDFVVLDECAFIKEAAWTEALRPALSDRQGRALFISTPKGRNWFWRHWQRGYDGSDGEWKSWRFPTSSNPYIPVSEIEAAKNSLPDRIFRQEYLAEFIDDAGGVFRGVMDAATAEEQTQATPGHAYVMGVDWGKYNDFTVLAMVDATNGEVVAVDRFNQIDWAIQTGRLKALYERFMPDTIIAERNSMGDPLVEQLIGDGLPVMAFTTTNASKAQIIDGLALAFERKDIKILADPVLVSELQAFEAQRLPSGMLRYSAPDGMHDDTVMALAMAWHGLARGGFIWGLA